MSLTFWDTVRGHHLADTLIRYLPQLVDDRKQLTYRVPKDEVYDKIDMLIEEGMKIVSCIDNGTNEILIIATT
jgi:hypothetical protein